MEATPEDYVANMVSIFREVRRVLRDDGTLWLNLGDSFARGKCGRSDEDEGSLRRRNQEYGTALRAKNGDRGANAGRERPVPAGLKPKDLVGIPWRVAFALQADGWHLRSDIIWEKPNCMPESVKDRPTRSHEYIFLLTKGGRYYYDHGAIAEPAVSGENRGGGRKTQMLVAGEGAKNDGFAERWQPSGLRNKRSVWRVATQPFEGAHFAVFPPKLIRPCVLAGCPFGGTILDPFGGSGTTALVAEELGRHAILIELNDQYMHLARERTAQSSLITP
jgi:DNA modification methylase